MISRCCREYGVENNVRKLQPYQLSIRNRNVSFYAFGECKYMTIIILPTLICCGLRANLAFGSSSSFFNWTKSIANLYFLSHLLLWALRCLPRYRIFLLTFIIGLKLRMVNLSKLRPKKMRALTVPRLVARLRKGLMMHGWVLTLEGIEIPSFSTKSIEITWGDVCLIDANFIFLIDLSF